MVITMASIHPSLVSLLFIPIFPLLIRKIFHLLVSFLFLLHTAYSSEEDNSLRLFIVVYILVVFIYVVLSELYATFIATIANMGQL